MTKCGSISFSICSVHAMPCIYFIVLYDLDIVHDYRNLDLNSILGEILQKE